LETKNPVKPDKAVCPVKLYETEYPAKLEEVVNTVRGSAFGWKGVAGV